MLEVISAQYVEGHKIRVSFNTGQSGIVDLKDALWGPVFEPIKAPSTFRQFKLSETLHTICWDNDADFAPEFLLDRMVEQSHEADAPAPRR